MSAKILVVGLGPGRADLLSLGALEALRSAGLALVRTSAHPAVTQLSSLGVKYQSLDWVYEANEKLEEVYAQLAAEVIKAARQEPGSVVYAVPGNPLVAEASVGILLEQAQAEGLEIEVIPSLSSVELCLARLGFDPLQGFRVANAQAPGRSYTDTATLFLQVDARMTASELKILLLEAYPAEHKVALLHEMGVAEKERVVWLPLAELDRREDFSHLTSLFVPALEVEAAPVVFQELIDIMARLRSPEGCPWDREQDHVSLRVCLEEETQEVLEAIEQQDPRALCEELGDLLLQTLFHAQLAAEVGDFDIGDVLRGLRDKLIERHPHVFGGEKLQTAAQVLEAWDEIKRRSKKGKG